MRVRVAERLSLCVCMWCLPIMTMSFESNKKKIQINVFQLIRDRRMYRLAAAKEIGLDLYVNNALSRIQWEPVKMECVKSLTAYFQHVTKNVYGKY